MRDAFDRRRRLAVEMLSAMDGVELAVPEGAFYVFPSIAAHLGRTVDGTTIETSLDFADVLLDKAKVAVVPGEGFGAPGCVRISYALGDDELEEGLTRLGKFLAG
jgi:aspartate/methionine/tyrosine aminotransferase